MFITNIDKVSNKFACKKVVAEYIMKNGIPLFGRHEDTYYFANTFALKRVLDKMPILLKIVHRYMGVE